MSKSNSKDPDGSYYHNNDDDELINNYYSDLLNQPAFFSSTTTNNDGPANNNEPDYGREAFSTTSTLTSINDYDITGGGSGGDYNNYINQGEGQRIFRYANTGDSNDASALHETTTDGSNTNSAPVSSSHESPTNNTSNNNTSDGSPSGNNNIIISTNNKGETYGWEEISVDYGQHQQSPRPAPEESSDESKEVGIIQSVLGILGLSSAINNKRATTEVVQEGEDIEKGTLVQDPTTTRGSKPTTSEGSDNSSGGVRNPLFIFKKKGDNKQQQQQRRQSRRRSGEHQDEGINNDEYHWNEVNISNTDSDNTSSTTKRKKLAAFFTRCCHIPTLIILLLLLLGSVATVISIIILRRGGDNRSGDGGIKLDNGGLNDFPTSSPTNTKLVNACVCYPINNTTNSTNTTNNTTNDNNAPPFATINSGVYYNIGGINYQCLDDNNSITPEYLTICIYPTDITNLNGLNYGKTNDEQVINVDGGVTISTFGELTAVQLTKNINEEINVVGVTSFGTLNVNNLDMSLLLLLNTDNLLLEEEIMNYYEDAIKMGKFYINILIIV